MDDVVDNSEQPMKDVNIYKTLESENIDHYSKFSNQTRDPRVAVYEDDEMYFGTEDTPPEFFAPEDRESSEFNKFE